MLPLHSACLKKTVLMQTSFCRRNKKEARSYTEISASLGVDKPSDILFVTDVYQEATAAKAAGMCLLSTPQLILLIIKYNSCIGSFPKVMANYPSTVRQEVKLLAF